MKNVILLLLITVSFGCRTKEEPARRERAERPPAEAPANLVKIQGTVTLDGKPLTGGMVMFLPEDQDQGRPASGTIDRDGSFELGTVSPGDGIVPGKYRVVVTASERPGGKDGIKTVPVRYSDQEKTPLRHTITTADIDRNIRLELRS